MLTSFYTTIYKCIMTSWKKKQSGWDELEDNGKQGRQFCLRLEYSNVERVSNRMSYQQRRRYLATDQEVQSAQNKSTRGME